MIGVLPLWAALPATVLLILSGLITVTGSLGLLRFDHAFPRMHAPTLGNTAGLGFMLVASMLISSAMAERPIFHEVVILLLVILTSPISAVLLMQAAIRRDRRRKRQP